MKVFMGGNQNFVMDAQQKWQGGILDYAENSGLAKNTKLGLILVTFRDMLTSNLTSLTRYNLGNEVYQVICRGVKIEAKFALKTQGLHLFSARRSERSERKPSPRHQIQACLIFQNQVNPWG